MLSWINSWASSIVIAVIMATIIEMILPEGSNKKYVKTVIGVFVLFTILGPILGKITGNNFELESGIQNLLNIDESKTAQTSALKTSNSIATVYISNLKEDISKRINEKGYKANQINVMVNMDEENYGEIQQISLQLAKEEPQDKQDIATVNIVEVQIGKDEINYEKDNRITAEEYECMRKYIADYYEIKIENVNIY